MSSNPRKRPLNDREPGARDGMPEPPDWLSEEARSEWDRVVQHLAQMGLLSAADRPALAAYCTASARWVEAEAMVRKFGPIVKSREKNFPKKSPYLSIADQALETMRNLMVEFGLTPSSRSRIKIPSNDAGTSSTASWRPTEKDLVQRLADARSEGWDQWIKTEADERAVRDGCRFNLAAAERVRTLVRKFLRHSEGQWTGKPFEPLDWQWERIIPR